MSSISKKKKLINKIISDKLREIGIDYLNMSHATYQVSKHLGMYPPTINRAQVAFKITGHGWIEAQVRKQDNSDLRRDEKEAERQSRPKPKYLPGIPSASTLERDIKSFYESWEWKTMSYNVKLNRGRRCECCGAAPPEVRIVTDHIKPLRHFWHLRLQEDNLQVLCDDCNMGKGSRDQTDFRAELTTPPSPCEEEEVRVEWGDTWDDIPLNGYSN